MKHLLEHPAIFLSALLLLGFAEGKAFDKWTTTSEGVTFASETSAETTFKMPAKDVAVTATYCHNHSGKRH